MRRWRVVIRVKRYPVAAQQRRTPSILDPFELGEVVSVESRRHFTRWGAESKALRLNMPPALMWRAVAERAS